MSGPRARQYEELYDLLSESTIARIYRGQSRAEFVAASHKGNAEGTSIRLLEFTPTEIDRTTRAEANVYSIYGRAKLCEQGRLVEKLVIIEAELQNGAWYFSTIVEFLND